MIRLEYTSRLKGRVLGVVDMETCSCVPSDTLENIKDIVRDVSSRYALVSFAGIFGSASRGEMSEASDIDVYACFDDGASYLDVGSYQQDLAAALGREVDVLTNFESVSRPFFDNLKRNLRIAYER